jgi:hypothetical protein
MGRMGTVPRVIQPRFLGAVNKTLMELKLSPEHVRE